MFQKHKHLVQQYEGNIITEKEMSFIFGEKQLVATHDIRINSVSHSLCVVPLSLHYLFFFPHVLLTFPAFCCLSFPL